MSESLVDQNKADLDALRALQADASELKQIEYLLDRFNAYETSVGFDKDEVMHSNFLASLLDPKRTGVLGDLLIKELLRETLAIARETLSSSAFAGLNRVIENLDAMDLSQTLVRREHHYIDVLLTNEDHKIAVIIENKIWASEGPGQLNFYDRIIRYTHPGWDVHRIYLTPHGGSPSHEAYVPFSYGALCDIVDKVSEDRGSDLDPEVRVPAQHYARMVRRRILGDPEIVRMAEDLYLKHKRAFDFVYEHLPDVRQQIKEMVEGLITQEEPRLALYRSQKDKIRFGVSEWNTPALLTSEDRTPSNHILLFEFWNDSLGLNLNLFIKPGPAETRRRLLEIVRAYPDVFWEESVADERRPIFHRTFLTKQQAYENLDREEREQEIRSQWDAFLEEDLPRIEAALKKETWIWESVEPEERT